VNASLAAAWRDGWIRRNAVGTWLNPSQSHVANAAGARAGGRPARYFGAATSLGSTCPSLIDLRLLSPSRPMRIARSMPSPIRSCRRSLTMSDSRTLGWRRAKAARGLGHRAAPGRGQVRDCARAARRRQEPVSRPVRRLDGFDLVMVDERRRCRIGLGRRARPVAAQRRGVLRIPGLDTHGRLAPAWPGERSGRARRRHLRELQLAPAIVGWRLASCACYETRATRAPQHDGMDLPSLRNGHTMAQ